jgi:hypothetical protein
MSQRSKRMRVNVEADKTSIQSRGDRANLTTTVAPASLIYKTHAQLQESGLALGAAGVELTAANAALKAAKSALATARGVLGTKVLDFDAAYDVYVAHAEKFCTTPEDVTGLGLDVLDRGSYALAAPLEVLARFDVVTGLIHIHVKKAPGMRSCVVEISSNPADPTSWQRLPGVGAIHTLRGYAPGMYWVRAASVRAKDQSDFTARVAVIVT